MATQTPGNRWRPDDWNRCRSEQLSTTKLKTRNRDRTKPLAAPEFWGGGNRRRPAAPRNPSTHLEPQSLQRAVTGAEQKFPILSAYQRRHSVLSTTLTSLCMSSKRASPEAKKAKVVTPIECVAFDLRQEAQCGQRAAPADGYAPGEVVERLLALTEKNDVYAPRNNAYPFTAEDFALPGEDAGDASQPTLIAPARIMEYLERGGRGGDTKSSLQPLPHHVEQAYREILLGPSGALSDVAGVQVSPTRTGVLLSTVLRATNLPAVVDESIMDVMFDFLCHRDQTIDNRRVRLHCLGVVPQGGGKTPIFHLTRKALHALKASYPKLFCRGPGTNLSEYAWMAAFESANSTCLQMSDEFTTLLQGNATMAPRIEVLLKGFLDGEFAPGDNKYQNAVRVNKFLSAPRMNRAGLIQMDRAEDLVFGAIRSGDAGEYKRVELAVDQGGSCPLSHQIPIDGAIRSLRKLQLEGALRVRGHVVQPECAKLTKGASDLLNAADAFFRSLAARLTTPARNFLADVTTHLLGHSLAKATSRLSDVWVRRHRAAEGLINEEAALSDDEDPVHCFCKQLATERLLNDPSMRSVLSRNQYGELGFCCANWETGGKKPRFDCGFVLPGDEKADYILNCSVLPGRAREKTTAMQGLSQVKHEDVVFATNHVFRALATLELECRHRGIGIAAINPPKALLSNIEDFVGKFESLLGIANHGPGGARFLCDYHVGRIFGKGKRGASEFSSWLDSCVLSKVLIGGPETFTNRKGNRTWRRQIAPCKLRRVFERSDLPSIASYPTNIPWAPPESYNSAITDMEEFDSPLYGYGVLLGSTERLRQLEPVDESGLRAAARTEDEASLAERLIANNGVAVYKQKKFGRMYAGNASLQMLPKTLRLAALPDGDNSVELDLRRSFYAILLRQYLRYRPDERIALPFLESYVHMDDWAQAIAGYYEIPLVAGKRFCLALMYPNGPEQLNGDYVPQVLLLRNEVRVAVSALSSDPLWHTIAEARPEANTVALYLGEYENRSLLEMREWLMARQCMVHCLVFDGIYCSLSSHLQLRQGSQVVFQELVATVKRHDRPAGAEQHGSLKTDRSEPCVGEDKKNRENVDRPARGNCLVRSLMTGYPETRCKIMHLLDCQAIQCVDLPCVLRQVDLLSDWTCGVLLCRSSLGAGGAGHAVLLQRGRGQRICKVIDGAEHYAEDLANIEGVLIEPGGNSSAGRPDFPLAFLAMAGIHRQRKDPQDVPRFVEKLPAKSGAAYKYRRIQKFLDDPKLKPAGYVSAATKSNRTKAVHRCTLCGESSHKAPSHRYFFHSVNAHPDKKRYLPKWALADVRKYQEGKPSSHLAEGGRCTRISAGRRAEPGRYCSSGRNYIAGGAKGATANRKLRDDGSMSTVDLCLMGGSELWAKFFPETRCSACGERVAEFRTQRCVSAQCRKRISRKVITPISTTEDRQLCRLLVVVRSFALAFPVSQCHVASGFDRRVISQYYQILTKKLCEDEKQDQANAKWIPPRPGQAAPNWTWQLEADEALAGKRVENVAGSQKMKKFTSAVVLGFVQRGDPQSLILKWVGDVSIVAGSRRMPRLRDSVWHTWWERDLRERFLISAEAETKKRAVLNTDGHEMYRPKHARLCYTHHRVVHEDNIFWLKDLETADEWGTEVLDRWWRTIRHYGRMRDGTTSPQLLESGEGRVFAAAWLRKKWCLYGGESDPLDRVTSAIICCLRK